MSQKVAYVTGGMGGIGTAICQRLHKEGFKVIAGCGPTRDHAKWLGEQSALGYTFYASVGNVGDWDSTVEAFAKTKAEHGTIDVRPVGIGCPAVSVEQRVEYLARECRGEKQRVALDGAQDQRLQRTRGLAVLGELFVVLLRLCLGARTVAPIDPCRLIAEQRSGCLEFIAREDVLQVQEHGVSVRAGPCQKSFFSVS
eukprot:gene58173-77623_t